MELDHGIFKTLSDVDWFVRCGTTPPVCGLNVDVEPVGNLAAALESTQSPKWQDVRTEAQGDVTGFLAKNHSNLYGGHWNRLAKESRRIIKADVMPSVDEALRRLGGSEIADSVLLDLNRIALHTAYTKRSRRLPTFFGDLLGVYAYGHLPCGWNGSWPQGGLIVF